MVNPGSKKSHSKNITERKKAEKELKQQYYFEKAQELGKIGTWELDLIQNKLVWTDENCRIFGVPEGTVVNYEIFLSIVHPDDREYVDREWKAALERKPYDIEHRIVVDGKTKWVREKAEVEYDEHGNAASAIGFTQDITERKQMEGKLQFLSHITEQVADSVITTNLNYEITWVNQAFQKLYGYSQEEVLGRIPDFLNAEPNSKEIQNDVYETISSGKVWRNEALNRKKDGSTFPCEFMVFPLLDEQGNTLAYASHQRDITERKKTEELLHKSEHKYRTLVEANPYGIQEINTYGIITYTNPAYQKMLGYTEQELLGKSILDLIEPESRQDELRDFLSILVKEHPQPTTYEQKNRTKDNRIIDMAVDWNYNRDNEGCVVGFTSVITDITKRKKTEKTLRLTQFSVDNSTDAVYWMGPDARLIYVNNAAVEALGYSEEELLTMTVHDIGPEFPAEVWPAHWAELKEKKSFVIQTIHQRKDESTFPVEITVNFIQFGDREINCAIARDITERKKAEEKLQQESLMRKTILDHLPCIAMILKKGTREIVVSNEAAKKMGAVPGKTCYQICAQRDDPCPWCRAPEVWATNEPRRIEVSYEDTYYEGIWVPLTEELYVHYIFDISDRKRAELKIVENRQQLKSLASQLSITEERERRRIATELHDQIGQSLVFSKIKLDELHQSATSSELTKALDEICNNIGQIIQDTKTLTFDLSSPILNEIGLEAAISDWLDVQIEAKHGIETEFVDDGQQKPLDDDIQALLFRNVRELLVNVIKHAKANKVKVSISRVEEQIHIDVEDDGKGFDSVKVASGATEETKFGLFSIRERLEHLGGSFEIDSKPGSGSKFLMTAPIKQT